MLGLVVGRDEAKLLLDGLDDFHLGGGGERVARLEEELSAVLGDNATGDLHLLDGVRDGETLEHGHGVSNTITGVNDETGGTTVGVQGHDGLDGDVDVVEVESLEKNRHHLLSVDFGVHGGLSDQATKNIGGLDSELVVEGVMPDLLHAVPVVDDTGLDGVAQVEDTSLLVGLVTNVLFLLGNTLHGTGSLGLSNDSGEDDRGGLVTGDTGLHHT